MKQDKPTNKKQKGWYRIMGNMTHEQVKNINSKCMNDWRLDVEYYIFHNEKTLVKHIKLDDEHYLEFTLRYNYKNQTHFELDHIRRDIEAVITRRS